MRSARTLFLTEKRESLEGDRQESSSTIGIA